MKIFHYENGSGMYLDTSVADENPLVPGEYLIPANCTVIEPPGEVEDGYVLVFSDGMWRQVIDKRGLVYWLANGEERKIETIDTDVPEDSYASRELVPKTDEEIEIEMKADRRDKMLEGSVYGGVSVSLTSEDGGALIQVKNAFEFGIEKTVIYFSNGAKLPMTAEEFPAFAKWFIEQRNKFF